MKLKIIGARLSFPELWTPSAYQGQGDKSYKAVFLVPATGGDATAMIGTGQNPTQWGAPKPARALIDEAILTVAKDKWGARATGILTANEGIPQKHCFLAGEKKAYDGYAGNWALSASRGEDKGAPITVGRDGQPLKSSDGVLYGGCYVIASVELWAQDNAFGKAVRCTLNGVQFFRKGDAFGGGSPASADDFEALADGATADDLE